jgi:flagellar motor switch protein FliN
MDALDKQAFAVPFSFEDSDASAGEGMLIGAQVLFALAQQGSGGHAPQLSPEEMSDILSGFDAGQPKAETGAGQGAAVPPNLDLIMDIGLVCTARLGRVEMPIADILTLGPGSILEMGHLVDEPIELLVNDKLIARGDVVVVDEKFGLRITEIVSQADRIKSLL